MADAVLYDGKGRAFLLPIDSNGRVVFTPAGAPTALTDRSGTATSGGTAQNACAANTSRKFLLIDNPHTTDDLFFNTEGAATTGAGSVRLPAGQGVKFDGSIVPSGAVSVLSATTGRPFTVKEG